MMSPSPSRSSVRRRDSRAFTLTELLVVIAVIGILAGIIIPVIGSARRAAKNTECLSNLRAIGQGFALFLQDNKNRYPGNGTGSSAPNAKNGGSLRWNFRVAYYMDLPGQILSLDPGDGSQVAVRDYAHNQPVFHCPITEGRFYQRVGGANWSLGGYGCNPRIIPISGSSYNIWGITAASIQSPPRTVLLADRFAGGGDRPQDETALIGLTLYVYGEVYPGRISGPAANHRVDGNAAAGQGLSNVLFTDGHVDAVPLDAFRAGATTGITFIP